MLLAEFLRRAPPRLARAWTVIVPPALIWTASLHLLWSPCDPLIADSLLLLLPGGPRPLADDFSERRGVKAARFFSRSTAAVTWERTPALGNCTGARSMGARMGWGAGRESDAFRMSSCVWEDAASRSTPPRLLLSEPTPLLGDGSGAQAADSCGHAGVVRRRSRTEHAGRNALRQRGYSGGAM